MTMVLGNALFLLTILSAPHTVEVERYRLQSNPWVNLHQRLLYQAQFDAKPPARLTDQESTTWQAAVATYRTLFKGRSVLFNRDLVSMNAALSTTTGPELPATIPPGAAEALLKAMPVYERAQWPEDDLANRFWISIAEPMLASAGPELLAAHAKAYGMPFPKRIVVDVSAFGGEYGGYTVGDADSVHTVISPADPAFQGFAALEMLMHEPSHGIVGTVDGAIGADLARAAKELGRKPHHNLWHALLFFTSGELTRQALARRGIQDYQPIVYRGMFDRQYRGLQKPIETHWGAVLAGTKSREEAIRQILLETSKAEP